MWCCRDADDNFYDRTEGVQRQKQVVPEALDAATLLGQKVCLRCAMLRCAVARCAGLGWAVLCCAVLCCAGLACAVPGLILVTLLCFPACWSLACHAPRLGCAVSGILLC